MAMKVMRDDDIAGVNPGPCDSYILVGVIVEAMNNVNDALGLCIALPPRPPAAALGRERAPALHEDSLAAGVDDEMGRVLRPGVDVVPNYGGRGGV